MIRQYGLPIEQLDAEYDRTEGFIGLVRSGHYDSRAAERLVGLLESIELPNDSTVDRRLVSLLWYMPLIIDWQRRRFSGDEAVALEAVLNKITSQIERILGVP